VRVLLDTHTFLWWNSSHGSRLSVRAREVLEEEATDGLVSVVSAYEIAMKAARGSLELPTEPSRYVPDRLARHGFEALAIELRHVLRAGALPFIHRDPFDRLLIAQAQLEGVPIITADPAIAQYDVEVIW
jgi:PIN domain nuclease of toxin-antitoxin system